MTDFERIYTQWHEYARTRNTEALISLYADDAQFESPLVPVIMQQDSGTLHGREAILAFLQEGTRRRPNELVRWYRTGQYFVAGDTLVWEYPRHTSEGNQVDILELMQIQNGKIQAHCIYLGWFGTQMLIQSAANKK